jgi:hypothetical protein
MNQSQSAFRTKAFQNMPLIIALLSTAVYVFLLERSVLQATGGVFSYPLDDPFIHMQVAKNLAFHHTWGINPGEFGSASSSLLYTLLLTVLFKIFSVNVLIPFIINCIAAFLLLTAIHRWLLRQEVAVVGRVVILVLLVFLAPLPILMISGMEHVLQCLFTFLFVTSFAEWLGGMRSMETGMPVVKVRSAWPVFIYAILVTAVRYEGLFLIALACLLLLFCRKLATSVLLGLVAIMPIVIFGIISVRQGSYFLPNSVLMKSEGVPFSIGGLVDFVKNILEFKWTLDTSKQVTVSPPGISLTATQRLLILLPLTYLFFTGSLRKKPDWTYFLIILTGCTLLHLAFAATGWFYRYEAYLIVNAVVIVSVIFYQYGREGLSGKGVGGKGVIGKGAIGWGFALLLGFAVGFPFLLRSSAAYTKAKRACLNIYEQQYQMGQFLRKYYQGDVIAANDIGAIAYYGNIQVVDLWGLGSIDVAHSKKGGYWTPPFLDSLVRARGVKLAIVYETWFPPKLLDRWTKIATWQIPENVICGSDVVTFYVIGGERDAAPEGNREEDKKAVLRNLQDFQKSLPGDIRVIYY